MEANTVGLSQNVQNFLINMPVLYFLFNWRSRYMFSENVASKKTSRACGHLSEGAEPCCFLHKVDSLTLTFSEMYKLMSRSTHD